MISKLKKFYKVSLILSAILLLISSYISLALNHIYMGLGNELNPIILISDIFTYGFPVKCMITVFAIIAILILILVLNNKRDNFKQDERNFKYSDSGVYGTAGLLTENELEGYAKINTPQKAIGTILGQLDTSGTKLINTDMESRMNRHVAIFGCSGSGKSRCYARPFLIQAVKRRESVIVTDPKGELYESTAQYMKDNGYIVKVFDLVHPEKSDGWACLKELRGDEIRSQIFANVVINNTGSGKGDIWDTSAMSLLKALILRVERGKDFQKMNNQSIGAAYELIQNPRGEAYLDDMFDVMRIPSKEEQICIGPYMSFKQASDNMRGNIIAGLANRMQVFQNEVIKQITSEDDIDLTLPAIKPCAYYCIMSDQHGTLNFLSTLFFTYLFMDQVEYADLHGGKCPVPVNYLLDEFPNIGSIPDFDKKIATVRSRMLNISIIFQGITQLQDRYPHTWTSILGNCDTHLFLGCNEEDTASFISDRAGETTVKVGTVQHDKYESWLDFRRRRSSGDGKRKIFTKDEVRRFDNDKSLVFFRGLNAMLAYKYDFSKHPESKKFRDIHIADRANINDVEGRRRMKEEDELCMQKYLQRVKNKNSNEEIDSKKKSILKNIIKKNKKQDTENSKKIKEGSDIELSNSEYTEFDNDIVSDVEIIDDESFVLESFDVDHENENASDINDFDTNTNASCYQTDTSIPSDAEIAKNFEHPPTGKKRVIRCK